MRQQLRPARCCLRRGGGSGGVSALLPRGCPFHSPTHPGRDRGVAARRSTEGPGRHVTGVGSSQCAARGPGRAGSGWAGPGGMAGCPSERGAAAAVHPPPFIRPQAAAAAAAPARTRPPAARRAGGQRPAPRHGRPGRQRSPGGHHLRLRRWVALGLRDGVCVEPRACGWVPLLFGLSRGRSGEEVVAGSAEPPAPLVGTALGWGL